MIKSKKQRSNPWEKRGKNKTTLKLKFQCDFILLKVIELQGQFKGNLIGLKILNKKILKPIMKITEDD